MSDRNQSGSAPEVAFSAEQHPADQGSVRVLLWVLIVLTAAANAITSLGGFPVLVSAGFGLLSVTCIVLLVVHHLSRRR